MSTTIQYKGNTLATVSNNTKTLKTAGKYMEGDVSITDNSGSEQGTVWQDAEGYLHLDDESGISLQTKSATPSETAQTIKPDAGYYALDKVNVGAISSTYVGSGITRRSSTDLTVSGATVTVPSGYYSAAASKSVASMTLPTAAATSATSGYTKKATIGRSTSTQYINIGTGYNSAGGYYEISAVANGTAGTPTATKGTVSNHSISVTPSVTNTTGYITGGTKSGTAVSVSASELVSGTLNVTSSGTKDVTNYASASVPNAEYDFGSGEAGFYTDGQQRKYRYNSVLDCWTAGWLTEQTTYSMNTVYNAIPINTSVTPTTSSQTIGGAKYMMEGAVTVNPIPSQYIIPSGTLSITQNGTADVTNYASVNVNVSGGGGGSSNLITGTFTTNSTGGTQTISVPYSGNGFVISISIFLSEGAYNTSGTAYSTIHQYGMAYFTATKCNHTTPNYTSGTNDKAMTLTRYKSSATNATTMTSTDSNSTSIYDSINGPNNTSATGTLRIQSPTSLSIYVSGASATYGFLPSTEYTYIMSYSS